MKELAAELRSDALAAIEEFGGDIAYLTTITGPRDLSTGKVPVSETSHSLKALVEDNKGTSRTWDQVATGDKRFTCAAASFSTPPTMTGRIQFNGHKYNLVDFEEFYVGNDPVIYLFHGRKLG